MSRHQGYCHFVSKTGQGACLYLVSESLRLGNIFAARYPEDDFKRSFDLIVVILHYSLTIQCRSMYASADSETRGRFEKTQGHQNPQFPPSP